MRPSSPSTPPGSRPSRPTHWCSSRVTATRSRNTVQRALARQQLRRRRADGHELPDRPPHQGRRQDALPPHAGPLLDGDRDRVADRFDADRRPLRHRGRPLGHARDRERHPVRPGLGQRRPAGLHRPDQQDHVQPGRGAVAGAPGDVRRARLYVLVEGFTPNELGVTTGNLANPPVKPSSPRSASPGFVRVRRPGRPRESTRSPTRRNGSRSRFKFGSGPVDL